MDIQEIRQLIKLVEKSKIDELEIEEEGKKIRISKNSISAEAFSQQSQVYMAPPAMQAAAPAANAPVAAAESVEKPASSDYLEVRSPMVGTFYRSPAPDQDHYVSEGDKVNEGSPLCIIEAMKLMNEVVSDYSGRIAKIMVENAQPVEYNQVLFLIEK
ncbi:MAG: acetyl-CoA carboxylase biotin carboxyl carrier protein [Calditrichia bacterium]